MWVFLSILGAFGQALGWAIKKQTLENKGLNNTLGAVSFFVAGVFLFLWWGFASDWEVPPITARFAGAALVVVAANVLAVWCAYRALDRAGFSDLMPYMALVSLSVVPVEYMLRHVLPTTPQLLGICLVVAGTFVFSVRKWPKKSERSALGYFLVTLLCYSFATPFMAVAVDASGSGLFSATVFHFGIAICFLPLLVFTNEWDAVRTLSHNQEWKKVLSLMLLAGAVIAFLDNGPVTLALETAKASEVIALKRTMPFFALILGVLMFRERITLRHILGTFLLVAGSVCVVLFR